MVLRSTDFIQGPTSKRGFSKGLPLKCGAADLADLELVIWRVFPVAGRAILNPIETKFDSVRQKRSEVYANLIGNILDGVIVSNDHWIQTPAFQF